jgi:Putative peptidoglycan binding domain
MKLISFGLFFLALVTGSLALSQTPAGTTVKRPAPKTATANSAVKKAPAKKGPASTAAPAARKPGTATPTTSKTRTGKNGKKTAAAAPARYRQLQPTPERYKEIQQALIDKGYLKHEPTGVWDQDSASALQQFQTDRKLSPTGKISSASLINLGLGPKISSDPITPPAPSAPNP